MNINATPPTTTGIKGGRPTYAQINLTGLFYESQADNLVAHAGGGQALALQLSAEINRITAAATSGDSVMLPASIGSQGGLTVVVVNHGANPVQVYGNGTETIDDVAAASGVSQMSGSVTIYTCTTPGQWYSNGIGTGYSGQYPTTSFVNGLTAHAGGGQGSATAISACIARFTTVATAGDSAILPQSAGGMQFNVSNGAAASMNVYPFVGDQMNGTVNAAFAVPAGKSATFYCAVAGQWHTLLSS